MATHTLSTLQSFVAPYHADPFWIGTDVHKQSYHLAMLRAYAKTFTLVTPATPEKLVEQFYVILRSRLPVLLMKPVRPVSVWPVPCKQKTSP